MASFFLQVYWPMDSKSYTGHVKSYDREANIHHVRPYINYGSNVLNSFKHNVMCNYDYVFDNVAHVIWISSFH